MSVSLTAIVLLALAVHGPILLMEYPASSLNANMHMFFAQHYADNWFNPWNEKWFGGFSQTTFPPLAHQWVAFFARFMSVTLAYMLVQLFAVMLLTVGIFRYARLWTTERTARIAAIGSVFLGSLGMMVYQAGDLPATLAAALMINGVVFFYDWVRRSNLISLLAAFFLIVAAGTSEHNTLIFGAPLFALPLLFLALMDGSERPESAESRASLVGVILRTLLFIAIAGIAVAIILAPFWSTLLHPVPQVAIVDDGSRDNFLFSPTSAVGYWLVPMGGLLLALPFIFISGLEKSRLRPLFFAFYLSLLMGLGSTTPVPHFLLGPFYQSITLTRFTFWATILALPIVAVAAERLIERFPVKGIIALVVICVFTVAAPFMWMLRHPNNPAPLRTDYMVNFLNRDFHNRYRYLTLGFGTNFGDVSRLADAQTMDGAYTRGKLIPELAPYGSLRLDNAKAYGAPGMEALRALLKHANQYGLKYIFVRDRFYEPMIAFAGWRPIEVYENGNVSLWGKEDIPTIQKTDPPQVLVGFQRITWSLFPILSSILGLGLLFFTRERRQQTAEQSLLPTADRKTAYRETR
jgi:6-pyruvoyl-tetrahydropterin synthase-like protein